MRLKGKRALVTGGTSGIGLAVARAFVNEGARVAITGRDQRKLAQAAEALSGEAIPIGCDAASVPEIEACYARLQASLGALDIVVANAGLKHGAPFERVTEREFDALWATNVKGVFFTFQKAVPLLNRGASLIINGSVASHAGSPNAALYGASKAAVRALARNLSSALVSRQVRVNVVSPGPIALSPGPEDPSEGLRHPAALTIPAGRFGTPEEVAHAVVFLASDESRFIVGTEIVIDGGRTQLPDGAPVYRALRAMGRVAADPMLAVCRQLEQ